MCFRMLQMWKLKNYHGAKMEVHVGDASTVLYNVPSRIDSKRSLQKKCNFTSFCSWDEKYRNTKR